MSTTVAYVDIEGLILQQWTYPESIEETCIKKKLVYKDILGNFMKITDKHNIYKVSSNSLKYLNINYLFSTDNNLHISLSNDIEKLILEELPDNKIRLSIRSPLNWGDPDISYIKTYTLPLSGTCYEGFKSGIKKYNNTGGYAYAPWDPDKEKDWIQYNPLPENSSMYLYNYPTTIFWDMQKEILTLSGISTYISSSVLDDGHYYNLEILQCVPRDMPSDITACKDVPKPKLAYYKSITKVKNNPISITKSLDFGGFSRLTIPTLEVSAGWVRNYNAATSDKIAQGVFGYWPCAMLKDPIDDASVTLCVDNNGTPIECDPSKTAFCNVGWEELLFPEGRPIIESDQYLNTGQPYEFGLCYDPNSENNLHELCENKKGVSALISIFRPVYIKQIAILKQYQEEQADKALIKMLNKQGIQFAVQEAITEGAMTGLITAYLIAYKGVEFAAALYSAIGTATIFGTFMARSPEVWAEAAEASEEIMKDEGDIEMVVMSAKDNKSLDVAKDMNAVESNNNTNNLVNKNQIIKSGKGELSTTYGADTNMAPKTIASMSADNETDAVIETVSESCEGPIPPIGKYGSNMTAPSPCSAKLLEQVRQSAKEMDKKFDSKRQKLIAQQKQGLNLKFKSLQEKYNGLVDAKETLIRGYTKAMKEKNIARANLYKERILKIQENEIKTYKEIKKIKPKLVHWGSYSSIGGWAADDPRRLDAHALESPDWRTTSMKPSDQIMKEEARDWEEFYEKDDAAKKEAVAAKASKYGNSKKITEGEEVVQAERASRDAPTTIMSGNRRTIRWVKEAEGWAADGGYGRIMNIREERTTNYLIEYFEQDLTGESGFDEIRKFIQHTDPEETFFPSNWETFEPRAWEAFWTRERAQHFIRNVVIPMEELRLVQEQVEFITKTEENIEDMEIIINKSKGSDDTKATLAFIRKEVRLELKAERAAQRAQWERDGLQTTLLTRTREKPLSYEERFEKIINKNIEKISKLIEDTKVTAEDAIGRWWVQEKLAQKVVVLETTLNKFNEWRTAYIADVTRENEEIIENIRRSIFEINIEVPPELRDGILPWHSKSSFQNNNNYSTPKPKPKPKTVISDYYKKTFFIIIMTIYRILGENIPSWLKNIDFSYPPSLPINDGSDPAYQDYLDRQININTLKAYQQMYANIYIQKGPNITPVTLNIYQDLSKNSSASINIGLATKNNKIKPGQHIKQSLRRDSEFSIIGNTVDYARMSYETDNSFTNYYIAYLQSTNTINYLKNTNFAYKNLLRLGFDIPFNPFRAKQFDKISSLTISFENSFIGGSDLSVNKNWYKMYDIYSDISNCFDNKYIQFLGKKTYGKPVTTCASFCGLWPGTIYVNSSKPDSSNILEACPCIMTSSKPIKKYSGPGAPTPMPFTVTNYYKKTWEDLGKNAWWYKEMSNTTIISYDYIRLGNSSLNKLDLVKHPKTCHEHCQLKSLLNYEPNAFTNYGAPTNSIGLCLCSTTPMNCFGCMVGNNPDTNEPISNADEYCMIKYFKSTIIDETYHVFGQCGNPTGTVDDSNNCVNCYIYDHTDGRIHRLNKKKVIEDAPTSIFPRVKPMTNPDDIKTYNELSLCYGNYGMPDPTTKSSDANNTCKYTYNTTGLCSNYFVKDSTEINHYKQCMINMSGNMCNPIKLTYKSVLLWQSSINGATNKTCKTICASKNYGCFNTIQYYNGIRTELSCGIPMNKIWLKNTCNDYKSDCCANKCSTLSGDNKKQCVKTCGWCDTSYNNDIMYNSDLTITECECEDTKHKQYCEDISSSLDCTNYSDGSYNCIYNSTSTTCKKDNKQCIPVTCKADTKRCKLPERIDDLDIPSAPFTSTIIANTDYLHHYCDCTVDRLNCKPNHIDWSLPTFALDSINKVTRPLLGTKGVLSKGNRGGSCLKPLPKSKTFIKPYICARDFSDVFNIDSSGKLTCQSDNDCSSLGSKYYCYRQEGTYCTSISGPQEVMKNKACRVNYYASIEASYNDASGIISIGCSMTKWRCQDSSLCTKESKNRCISGNGVAEDFKYCTKTCKKCETSYNLYKDASYSVDCNPPSLKIGRILTRTCSGSSLRNKEGNSIIMSGLLNISGNDPCNDLSTNGLSDWSLCLGNIRTSYDGNAVQCYYDRAKEKCVWAKDNLLDNVIYCTTGTMLKCNQTLYDLCNNLPSCYGNILSAGCIKAQRPPFTDTSFSDGSRCFGYEFDTINNTTHQCIYDSSLGSCVSGNTIKKHPGQQCTTTMVRTNLGFHNDAKICQFVPPIEVSTNIYKCLAYYSQYPLKPIGYTEYDLIPNFDLSSIYQVTLYSLNYYNKFSQIITHFKGEKLLPNPVDFSTCYITARNHNFSSTRFMYNKDTSQCKVVEYNYECSNNIACTVNISGITNIITQTISNEISGNTCNELPPSSINKCISYTTSLSCEGKTYGYQDIGTGKWNSWNCNWIDGSCRAEPCVVPTPPSPSSHCCDCVEKNDKSTDCWQSCYFIKKPDDCINCIKNPSKVNCMDECLCVPPPSPTYESCSKTCNRNGKKTCLASTQIDDNGVVIGSISCEMSSLSHKQNCLCVDPALQGWEYYSDKPEIWVSKSLTHPNSPYDCSDNPPGFPQNTGTICQETPIKNNKGELYCQPKSNYANCTTDLPPPLPARTCLLNPTPAPPKSPAYPDFSLGWNLRPYREDGNYNNMEGQRGQPRDSGYPESKCYPATIEDTLAKKYEYNDFSTCNNYMLLDQPNLQEFIPIFPEMDRIFYAEDGRVRCIESGIGGNCYHKSDDKDDIYTPCEYDSDCWQRGEAKIGPKSFMQKILKCYHLETVMGVNKKVCRINDLLKDQLDVLTGWYPGSKATTIVDPSQGQCIRSLGANCAVADTPNYCINGGTAPINVDSSYIAEPSKYSCGGGLTCYATSIVDRTPFTLSKCNQGTQTAKSVLTNDTGQECTCLYTNLDNSKYNPEPWATSFDYNITNTGDSKVCKRLVGHSCLNAFMKEDGTGAEEGYEDIYIDLVHEYGDCGEGRKTQTNVCGLGLKCYNIDDAPPIGPNSKLSPVLANPYNFKECGKDSKNCRCLPPVDNSYTLFPRTILGIPDNKTPFSMKWCGTKPYNDISQICCSDTIYPRRINGIVTKCCGNIQYNPDISLCCNNKLYDNSLIRNGFTCLMCGINQANYNSQELWGHKDDISCCANIGPYNSKTHTCCEVEQASSNLADYDSYVITDNSTQLCCDKSVWENPDISLSILEEMHGGTVITTQHKRFQCCKNLLPKYGINLGRSERVYDITYEKCCNYGDMKNHHYEISAGSVICEIGQYCGRQNDTTSIPYGGSELPPKDQEMQYYSEYGPYCRNNIVSYDASFNINKDNPNLEPPPNCPYPQSEYKTNSHHDFGFDENDFTNIKIEHPLSCKDISQAFLDACGNTCNNLFYYSSTMRKSFFCAKNDDPNTSSIQPCRDTYWVKDYSQIIMIPAGESIGTSKINSDGKTYMNCKNQCTAYGKLNKTKSMGCIYAVNTYTGKMVSCRDSPPIHGDYLGLDCYCYLLDKDDDGLVKGQIGECQPIYGNPKKNGSPECLDISKSTWMTDNKTMLKYPVFGPSYCSIDTIQPDQLPVDGLCNQIPNCELSLNEITGTGPGCILSENASKHLKDPVRNPADCPQVGTAGCSKQGCKYSVQFPYIANYCSLCPGNLTQKTRWKTFTDVGTCTYPTFTKPNDKRVRPEKCCSCTCREIADPKNPCHRQYINSRLD